MTYEIIIKGHLSKSMASHFNPLHIALIDDGYTRLTSYMPDQASLYGLLSKIRDLNIELVELKKMKD